MTLHREGKASIIIAAIVFLTVSLLAQTFLGKYQLLATLPTGLICLLIVWFFRVPRRNIDEHYECVIAPVDGKVVMIKEVQENDLFLCLH